MDNATLRRLNSWNPDGGSKMPTDADYEAFETLVVSTYGRRVWNEYTHLDEDTPYDPSAEDCIPGAAFHV